MSKINDGLDQCHCGVVFLSNDSLASAWQQDEISILKTYAVDEKRPLIPVLLDSGVKVPTILRPYSRLSADQVRELADAILNRSANKPALGTPRPALKRVRYSIHLRELPNSAVGVSAQLGGTPLTGEQTVTPGADFAFSYSDFVKARPFSARQQSAEAIGAERERDLLKLGDAVGRVVFAGAVGSELAVLLTSAPGQLEEIELVFESASPRLLSIPFEAARLPDGRIPALAPGVFSWRRPAPANGAKPPAPSPGPLKILVAVGAPDRARPIVQCSISSANWRPSSMPSKGRACSATPMCASSKSAAPVRLVLPSGNSAITCSIFRATATRPLWNWKTKTATRFRSRPRSSPEKSVIPAILRP